MNMDRWRRARLLWSCVLIQASISVAGCGGGGGGSNASQMPPVTTLPPTEPIPPPMDPSGQLLGELYAVTSGNRFVTFNPGAASLSTNLPISGLNGAESIVGVDVRTFDGTVYGVSNLGKIFTLNPRTGVVQFLIGTGGMLAGTSVGIEFIAAPEELRVVNDTGWSSSVRGFNEFRSDLQPGGLSPQTTQLLPAGITEIAGTQNAVRCGNSSSLYYLDTARDMLLVGNPNQQSALQPVGALAVDAESASGFEIFQQADDVGGVVSLYTIDLNTGRALLRAPIPGLRSNETIVGLARPPSATPRPRVGRMVGVTNSGKMVSFDERAPVALCTPPTSITGLKDQETILDIDVRPADGLLYALTSAAGIYTISTRLETLGAASFKSTLHADPQDQTNPFTGLTRPTAA